MIHQISRPLPAIKGLVIDLDGVLFVDNQPIDGATAALRSLKAAGLCCRYVTNTSTLSAEALHRKVLGMGLPIERRELISAPEAVHHYLRDHAGSRCCLLLADDVRREFNDVRQVTLEQADYIVLGDIGDALSRPLLDAIFKRLMEGGQLIAVHRNRFWQTGGGLRMDIGGFVAALEYCTGRQAIVLGKPSAAFFQVALADLGMPAGAVAMVGDDIDADIAGAQQVGLYGILTRTGKFRQVYVDSSPVHPDLIIDSIRELPGVLEPGSPAS